MAKIIMGFSYGRKKDRKPKEKSQKTEKVITTDLRLDAIEEVIQELRNKLIDPDFTKISIRVIS